MATDVFQGRISVELPHHADPWKYASWAAEHMHKVLGRLDGQVATVVDAEAVGGSKFERNSLEAARQALDEHDLEPALVYQWDELLRQGGVIYLKVTTVASFRDHTPTKVVGIVVEGADKVTVDGVVAEAERIGRKIEDEVADATREATADPSDATTQGEEHGWRAWLGRTWRENTALIVATAIGTFLGGLGLILFS